MENTNLVIDAIVVNSFVHLIYMPITDFFFLFHFIQQAEKRDVVGLQEQVVNLSLSLSALYKHSLTICMG